MNASIAIKNVYSRPFLKWPGGKYRLSERIRKSLGNGSRLIEPFVGSAAIFLNTDFEHYILADTNPDLINLYQILKNESDDFINTCNLLFTEKNNHADIYYAFRDEFNQTEQGQRRAALFIYLNRHCYNGLCRYNKKGGFNSPFGRYKEPRIPQQAMHAFHAKVQSADLVCGDFVGTMDLARPGDIIYCDPPYAPLSDTANFTNYHQAGFNWQQQQTLATKAEELALKGITTVISNHDTKDTRKLYNASKISSFSVKRFISCKSSDRKPAKELLAIYNPKNP